MVPQMASHSQVLVQSSIVSWDRLKGISNEDGGIQNGLVDSDET